MHLSEQDKVPQANETLAKYVQRLRRSLGLLQREVALKADIHPQSLGKLERGKTNCLNRSTQRGLAYALQIPEDYLEAVCRGEVLPALQTLKFCPKCWKAGMLPAFQHGFIVVLTIVLNVAPNCGIVVSVVMPRSPL